MCQEEDTTLQNPFVLLSEANFGLLDSLISVSFRCLIDKNISSSLLLRVMCEIKNSLLMRTVVYSLRLGVSNGKLRYSKTRSTSA